MPGREARESGAETIEVEARACDGHVLHPTASGDERVAEEGIFACPLDGITETRHREAVPEGTAHARHLVLTRSATRDQELLVSHAPNFYSGWADCAKAHGSAAIDSALTGFGQAHVGETCAAGGGARAFKKFAASSGGATLATIDDTATAYAAIDRNRTTAPRAEDVRHGSSPLPIRFPRVNVARRGGKSALAAWSATEPAQRTPQSVETLAGGPLDRDNRGREGLRCLTASQSLP